MSDPVDGEDSADARDTDGASDEEVRDAVARRTDGPSPGGSPRERAPEGAERRDDGGGDRRDEGGPDYRDEEGSSSAPDGPELREADLSAPASAADGDHTLLEEYEREQESAWKSTGRTAAFWVGATLASVALTTTAFVSLVRSGLPEGVAFFAASVAFAIVVGFVFLSLRRG